MDPSDTPAFAPAEAQLPCRRDAGVLGAGVSPGGRLRVAGTVPAGPILLEEEEEEGFRALGCPDSREQVRCGLGSLGGKRLTSAGAAFLSLSFPGALVPRFGDK